MKRITAFILILTAALSLIACNSGKESGKAASGNNTDNKDTTTTTEPGFVEGPDIGFGSFDFDFNSGDEGFTMIFADLPGTRGIELFYELKSEHKDVPIDGAGKGMFITGNNHSDDLFMGFYKELTGFEAGKSYKINLSFKIATDVEGGMIGIGGSPGESVYVKCGIVSQMPAALIADEYFRMNIDIGSQSQGGADMKVVGNITKQSNDRPGEYEFNTYSESFEVTADNDGRLWLIIATDSGFEGISSWYLDDVSLTPIV